MAVAKDRNIQLLLERKIALVTIKAISMSNLRDDWVVREGIFGAQFM
jgi:hypothetical protein